MTNEEKIFALDLLKALDIGMGETERTPDDYQSDLQGSSRREILKTVRYLIKEGYTKPLKPVDRI